MYFQFRAPQEYGLILAAGASDGAISIISYNSATNQVTTHIELNYL